MSLRLKANRRFPSIPVVVDTSENHTQVLMAVKEALDIGQRRTGDLMNSFIRVQDLIDLGLITIEGNTQAIVGADLSEIADIGDLTGAAAGDFLRFDGSEWVNDQLSPTDITQVMVTQHEAALTIDWSQLTSVPPAGAAALDDLTDVDAPTPADGDVLTWDAGASEWIAAAATGGAAALDDLTDVDAPAPTDGDVLTWNAGSSEWIAAASGGGADELTDLTDVNVATPLPGDTLVWDGYDWTNEPPAPAANLVYGEGDIAASSIVVNTGTETTFTGSEYIIDVTNLALRRVIRFKATGTYGTHSTPPTLRLKVKLGGTTVLDTAAFTTTASLSGRGWDLEGIIYVTNAGASGTVEAQGRGIFDISASDGQIVRMVNTAAVSVNLADDRAITITAQWGTANAASTITQRQMLVWVETAPAVVSLYTYWDSTTQAGNYILSNARRTAQRTGSGAWNSIRAAKGVSAGKYYWELHIDAGTLNNIILGVGRTTLSQTGYVGSDANSYGFQSASGGPIKWNNGSSSSYGTALAVGDTFMVALDMDNGKVWFGKNGTWMASGDPAAGTNASFSSVSGTQYPAIGLFDTTGVVTARFDPANFGYTPPSGFGPLAT